MRVALPVSAFLLLLRALVTSCPCYFVASRQRSTTSLAIRPRGATLIRFFLAHSRTSVRSYPSDRRAGPRRPEEPFVVRRAADARRAARERSIYGRNVRRSSLALGFERSIS